VAQESNIKHIAAAFVDLEPDLINMAGFLLPFKREGKIKKRCFAKLCSQRQIPQHQLAKKPSTHQPQDLPFKFLQVEGFF